MGRLQVTAALLGDGAAEVLENFAAENEGMLLAALAAIPGFGVLACQQPPGNPRHFDSVPGLKAGEKV